LFPAPIGEEAGKANADEAAREEMEQEAAQEFFGGDRHLALLAVVGIVLPAEADLAIGDGQKPMIGNGDADRRRRSAREASCSGCRPCDSSSSRRATGGKTPRTAGLPAGTLLR